VSAARGSTTTPSSIPLSPRIASALLRYRVMAYVTGVLLIALTISVVFKYTVGDGGVTSIVGVAHGWIYLIPGHPGVAGRHDPADVVRRRASGDGTSAGGSVALTGQLTQRGHQLGERAAPVAGRVLLLRRQLRRTALLPVRHEHRIVAETPCA